MYHLLKSLINLKLISSYVLENIITLYIPLIFYFYTPLLYFLRSFSILSFSLYFVNLVYLTITSKYLCRVGVWEMFSIWILCSFVFFHFHFSTCFLYGMFLTTSLPNHISLTIVYFVFRNDLYFSRQILLFSIISSPSVLLGLKHNRSYCEIHPLKIM